MYKVIISGYHLAEVSNSKPYHVYRIEVSEASNDIKFYIEKRYSEFNALHRTLKKSITQAVPFPPKKVRNSQPKVLEQRRGALEQYLQKMLRIPNTKQQVLNFLGIENHTSNACRGVHPKTDVNAQPDTMNHHPIFTFHFDPYVQANPRNTLPDIVTNGVLLGLYKTN